MSLLREAGSVGSAGYQEKIMIRVSTFTFAAAIAAMSLAMPASAKPAHAKAMTHPTDQPLYDVIPQQQRSVNSDDPSLTGGGSAGYNAMIYNW
jgi:hypothetical protein